MNRNKTVKRELNMDIESSAVQPQKGPRPVDPFADTADIRFLPKLQIQDIENLLNDHIRDNPKYPGHFKVGGLIAEGGFSKVYKLVYVNESEDAGDEYVYANYVVKVSAPIQTFLSDEKYIRKSRDYRLKTLKEEKGFRSLLEQRNQALSRMNHVSQKFGDRHFVRYYPDFSFDAEKPIPYVTLIVMEEVVCTLGDLEKPHDQNVLIQRIIKAGREIGSALQACEYPQSEADRFNHRDISVSNIGVRFTGRSPDDYEFVLIDCENGRRAELELQTQTVPRTRDFAAPELYDKTRRFTDDDFRLSDQYSLGAVLAWIADPYGDDPQGYQNVLPECLADIIDVCLETEPSNRWRDYQTFLDHLNDAADQLTSSQDTVSAETSREIEKRYQKQIEEKEKLIERMQKEFFSARNDLNRSLDQKNEQIRQQDSKLKQYKEDYGELGKQLAAKDREIKDKTVSLREKENELQSSLADYSVEIKRQKNEIKNLNIELGSYKKIFAKKKKPAENHDRLTRITSFSNNQETTHSDYRYEGSEDSYTEYITHNIKGYSLTLNDEKTYQNGRLIRKAVSTYLNEEPLITEYTYSGGTRFEKDYQFEKLIRTRTYYEDRILSEIIHSAIKDDERTFTYLYAENGALSSISCNKQTICTGEYTAWPDGSVHTEIWNVLKHNELLEFTFKLTEYSPDGLLCYEKSLYDDPKMEIIKRYSHDDEGRVIHEDMIIDGKPFSSIVYIYEASGRCQEKVTIDHKHGTFSRTEYAYLQQCG